MSSVSHTLKMSLQLKLWILWIVNFSFQKRISLLQEIRSVECGTRERGICPMDVLILVLLNIDDIVITIDNIVKNVNLYRCQL